MKAAPLNYFVRCDHDVAEVNISCINFIIYVWSYDHLIYGVFRDTTSY